MSSGCPSAQELQRFVLGNITETEAEPIERHLAQCRTCLQTLLMLRAEDALTDAIRLGESDLIKGPPESLATGLLAKIKALRVGSDAEAFPLDFLAPPRAPDELGRLGSYRVLKVLGDGGMGVVFQAEDLQLRRLVALKALKPVLAASNSARQRFLREARAMAALRNDHIVQVHQVGEERGIPYIAMEYLEGEPLDQWLERGHRLPQQEISRLAREIATGLQAAHQQGLVHRDIKPSNIWIEKANGRAKILDFGLARVLSADSKLTFSGALVGTPAFMSPEQARSQPADQRSDLFSLGGVLYYICTGRPPFAGNDLEATLLAVTLAQPEAPQRLNPEICTALSDLVMQLLAKEPAQRVPSADALLQALSEIERSLRSPGASSRGRDPSNWRELMQAQRVSDLVDVMVQLQILNANQQNAIRQDQQLLEAAPQELVRRGLVTPYQLNLLVQGRAQGLVFGQYLLLEPLGEGGMGMVFKARHRRLERLVALKIIRKERVSNAATVTRFHREAKAAAKLSDPHIVGIYDADEANGTHFLAMEFVNGVDLKKLVDKDGPIAPEQACDYIRQAAKGLQHAHSLGLVHRDIKPANLFLTKNEQGEIVKVLDFGLTLIEDDKARKTRITQVGSVVGSVDYMAPEQATSARDVDHRCDIYSLGCSLFYLLTGKPPFEGNDMMSRLMARLTKEPPTLIQHRGDLPTELNAAVKKMMAKDPAQRFQSAAEVVQALEPFVKRKTEVKRVTKSLPPAVPAASQAAAPVPAASAPPVAATAPVRAPAPAQPARRARQASGGGARVMIAAGIALAVIGGGIGAFMLMSSGNKGKDQDVAKGKADGDNKSAQVPKQVSKKQDEPPIRTPDPVKPVPPVPMPQPIPPKDIRAAVPPAAAQAEAEALIKDLFKADYAKTAAAERSAFAAKLLQQAGDTKDDPAARFVLFSEAQKMAAEAGDTALVLRASSALATEYMVDALATKVAGLEAAGANASKAKDPQAVVRDLLTVLDEAIDQDRFELTMRLEPVIMAACVPAKDEMLTAQAKARTVDAAAIGQAYKQVASHIEKLKSDAGNAEANLAVGKYQCFLKGRWQQGLVLLAKSGDEQLSALAKQDLAPPETDQAKIEVADGWWDLAAKTQGPETAQLRVRAYGWYKQALPGLAGLTKTKAESRCQAVENELGVVAPKKGTLVVKLNPPDGEILINMQALPAQPGSERRLELDPGKYVVTVRKSGFKPQTEDVQVVTGEVTVFSASLASLESPPVKSITNSIGMKLSYIPSGEFTMGSPDNEADRMPNEGPAHKVSITKPFYMGTYEVTQKQFESLVKSNPSLHKNDDFPVYQVTWQEADLFCERLSSLPDEKRAGRSYRLPTEAEWEYACRAGTSTPFHYGRALSSDLANVDGTRPYGTSEQGTKIGKPVKVGSYKPNAFGLYDMHGNAWEHCLDRSPPYSSDAVTDPRSPASALERVIRGGGWEADARRCRSAFRHDGGRDHRYESTGLRVVCEVSQPIATNGEQTAPAEVANSIGMKLIRINPGTFLMGSDAAPGPQRPQHKVTLTKPFYMASLKVTQGQFEKLMGANPSFFNKSRGGSPEHPVESMTHAEAMAFCAKLSNLPAERKAGRTYRLPTEAEWEYACRAGSTATYFYGDDPAQLGDYAWYSANSSSHSHPVGKKKPNAWGLYDMLGNVCDLCSDYHGPYESADATDPRGPTKGESHNARGGWSSVDPKVVQCARRDALAFGTRNNYIGFRVVCEISNVPQAVADVVPVGEIRRFQGHQAIVGMARFSPDGKRIASSADDKTVRIWEVATGKQLRSLPHPMGVSAVAWTPTGQVVSGTNDGSILLWDIETEKAVARFAVHKDRIVCIKLSPDGRFGLSSAIASDPTVRVWDLKAGKLLRICSGHSNNVFGCAFGESVRSGFSGAVDGTIRSWDLTNGKEVAKFSLPSVVPFPVVWLPHESHLLMGGSNGRLAVLDPKSGKPVREFVGHTGEIRGADASADGKRIISGSNDGTIRYWDASNGKELHKFEGLGGGVVIHLEISPNGRMATSVHNQPDTFRLWGLPKD